MITVQNYVNGNFVSVQETIEDVNPATGEIMMVKTGIDSNNQVYRYFIPSGQRSVFEVRVPTKGSPPPSQQEANMFRHSQRLLKLYTDELNIHGNVIN